MNFLEKNYHSQEKTLQKEKLKKFRNQIFNYPVCSTREMRSWPDRMRKKTSQMKVWRARAITQTLKNRIPKMKRKTNCRNRAHWLLKRIFGSLEKPKNSRLMSKIFLLENKKIKIQRSITTNIMISINKDLFRTRSRGRKKKKRRMRRRSNLMKIKMKMKIKSIPKQNKSSKNKSQRFQNLSKRKLA